MSLNRGSRFYRRTDFKITLWYVFTFVVTTSIIFSFMYVRLKHHLLRELDRFLDDESKVFVGEISENRGDILAAMRDFERDIRAIESFPIHARVLSVDGSFITGSRSFPQIAYPMDPEKLGRIETGHSYIETFHSPNRRTPFRILSVRLPLDHTVEYIVQIGAGMGRIRKTLSNFRHNMLMAIPVILFLGTIGGWYLARRSLSPVAHITETARRITASNLGERLRSRQSGDELDQLIATLNEMISRLEHAFKRIRQFTADASHELRTPISSMKGEAELLLSKPRPIEEYQRVLANHIEKLDFLNRVTNDLILLSKFDSDEAGLNFVRIRLDRLLVNLWELFRVLAEQEEITFTFGEIEPVWVLGDQTRLEQLFTNLIDNAVKFTPSGGRIDLSMKKDETYATVSVRDTGIGIPPEEFDRIFDRFYRVDQSRSRDDGGSGLGLSIGQWIARAHHGRIEVRSEVGKGSHFLVSLPLLADK